MHDLVGDAAEDQPNETRVAVRRHHHEIGFFLFNVIDDVLGNAHRVYDMQAAFHAHIAHFIAQAQQMLLDLLAYSVRQLVFTGDGQ